MIMPCIWKLSPIAFSYGAIRIYWYSVFVSLSWFYAFSVFEKKMKFYGENAFKWAEKAQWTFGILFLLGARLGHIYLYQTDYCDLKRLIYVWEGGLSGQTGGLLVLFWFIIIRYTSKNIPCQTGELMDIITHSIWPCMVAARIGNFFNHEIIGSRSGCFLGIIFLYAGQEETRTMAHPVQLYEALIYFLAYLLTKCCASKKPGNFFGIFTVSTSIARILLEPIKTSPKIFGISIGQILSLPFLCLGSAFLIRSRNKRSV